MTLNVPTPHANPLQNNTKEPHTMLSRTAMLLGLCATGAVADNYAVLVAGSNTYMNYRHQADVAHAYQVLVQGGIKADNIITMMYDDVANSEENPFPGQIFNKPTTGAGWDVYKGIKIDYSGKDVNKANFEAVLTGNASAAHGKRVLTSTSRDKVFVNFVDHGGVGLICFPGCAETLSATDLVKTLTTMHTKQMYSELVFYLEACESGSMFETLPTNLNIYAVTAANAKESSWGTYCPPQDVVNGKPLNSCLGDLFSVNWLENADTTNLQVETLAVQFEAVKKATAKSHVMQFGNISMTIEAAASYEGTGNVHNETASERGDGSDSRDVTLVTLHHRYLRAEGAARVAAEAALVGEIEARASADVMFAAIAKAVFGGASVFTSQQMYPQCYDAAHAAITTQCGGYTDYSLKHVKTIKALCDTAGNTASVLAAIATVC